MVREELPIIYNHTNMVYGLNQGQIRIIVSRHMEGVVRVIPLLPICKHHDLFLYPGNTFIL